MTPHYSDDRVTLFHGDCRDVLATLEDASVDSCVTDPPYELGFMGKRWDATGIAYDVDLWQQVLRVLKPGGHLLAFGGTRTYHRMASAIEDAGFDIRDSIHWLYGSGFPKSLDVAKAIDKRPGVRLHRQFAEHLVERREAAGLSRADVSEHVVGTRSGACWNWEHHQFPESKWWTALQRLLDLDESWSLVLAEAEREVVATRSGNEFVYAPGEDVRADRVEIAVTKAATEAAATWDGWGTALKPAHEPIVVARKPLSGTVADTVLTHGTGAININACRVGTGGHLAWSAPRNMVYHGGTEQDGSVATTAEFGRWPANVVITHDPDCGDTCHTDCPCAVLDGQTGVQKDGVAVQRNAQTVSSSPVQFISRRGDSDVTFGGSGGASRFFPQSRYSEDELSFRYVAKPSRSERDAGQDDRNVHPTVKPLELIRWLVRLVTPVDGVVLEPFAGSGTTLEAAVVEHCHVVGIELTADYLPIIVGRISKPIQPTLGGL